MRGAVEFEALGVSRVLRFTTNAICRIEERSKQSLQDVLADAAVPGKKTLTLRLLFWAGLGGGTLDEAGDIMDAIGAAEADRLLAEALRLAFPPQDASAEGNGEATAG